MALSPLHPPLIPNWECEAPAELEMQSFGRSLTLSRERSIGQVDGCTFQEAVRVPAGFVER